MTVRTLLNTLKATLSPSDAQSIIEKLLGGSRTQLILRADEELPDEQIREALQMKARREQGEPIQYILGEETFFGRSYRVGRGVLIPRDDTEVVVRECLRLIPENMPMRILDLCAGSGIIAITMKKERPLCEVCAVEKSKEAFSYLTQNIRRHHADVECILSDLSDCAADFADGFFDLIVSNPPYIQESSKRAASSPLRSERIRTGISRRC